MFLTLSLRCSFSSLLSYSLLPYFTFLSHSYFTPLHFLLYCSIPSLPCYSSSSLPCSSLPSLPYSSPLFTLYCSLILTLLFYVLLTLLLSPSLPCSSPPSLPYSSLLFSLYCSPLLTLLFYTFLTCYSLLFSPILSYSHFTAPSSYPTVLYLPYLPFSPSILALLHFHTCPSPLHYLALLSPPYLTLLLYSHFTALSSYSTVL